MLVELTVKNYGIIEEVDWTPAAGFNVITGETGAGKSLVVDAVEALLTGQVNETDIRHGSDIARIEGIFRMATSGQSLVTRDLLSEKGLESEDDTLLVSCDFRRQGRSTPRVNRQAVSRALLKDITASLLDIHGQSQHLSLLNKDRHLEYLDACAHTRQLREDFSGRVHELHDIEREIQKLSANERDMQRQKELLNFQIEEIKRAELQPGEEEELRKEQTLLASAEKLKAAAYEVYKTVYGDENSISSPSAVDRLSDVLPVMRQIAAADTSMQGRLDYLEEMVHGLEEMAREVNSYGENLNYDPQRLEEVQERLELLQSFRRKYGDAIEEMLGYLEKAESDLENLSFSDERRRELEKKRERLLMEMGKMAEELSGKRMQAAGELAAAVKKECLELNMAQVEFQVSIIREVADEGMPLPDGKFYKYDGNGVDVVEFLASTNPGEPLKSLDKIASTGEISRFMLAMKSALAGADNIPVLIFDEIDIGVGGRSGEVIGMKLWKLSRDHQVICVTHLPQIAAFADAQFNVSKESSGERTVSTIRPLEGESRLRELAVMLGGSGYTSSALDAARELLEKAAAWKNSL
ncbi:MAG TPA: DNA repair protein RecN [Dehalococcoidia bacterium]|nr:DNA repair protein RecN [Dehalococcoidia bacterium]